MRDKIIKSICEITNLNYEVTCANSDTSLFLEPFNFKVEMIINLYFCLKEQYKFNAIESELRDFAFDSIDSICNYIVRNTGYK